jgi:twin BRCT domain
MLTSNGAEELDYPSHEEPAVVGVTHIISSSSDFPGYGRARDSYIPVVKPAWVYASIHKKRIAQLRQYSPDPKLIFSDVVVTCVDLPGGDRDAIAGGVLAMGGQYANALTKLVTHVVALTDDSEKCIQARAKLANVKIVLPHW